MEGLTKVGLPSTTLSIVSPLPMMFCSMLKGHVGNSLQRCRPGECTPDSFLSFLCSCPHSNQSCVQCIQVSPCNCEMRVRHRRIRTAVATRSHDTNARTTCINASATSIDYHCIEYIYTGVRMFSKATKNFKKNAKCNIHRICKETFLSWFGSEVTILVVARLAMKSNSNIAKSPNFNNSNMNRTQFVM